MWRRRTRREALRRALVVVALVAPPARAAASPLEDPSAGGAVFTGPTHAHASSIFLNPAAIAFASRGLHLYIGGSLRLDSIQIDRRTVDPESGDLGPGPSVSLSTLSPGATVALYNSVLEERAVFGAALHSPTFERFPSRQPVLGYHSLGGYVYQTLLSLAGGFRLTDRIYFGLGVSLGYAGVRMHLQRDTALEAGSGPERGISSDCGGAPCGLENPEAAETIRLRTSTGGFEGLFDKENLAASAGLAVQVKSGWWTTISYVSPPGAIPAADYALALQGNAAVRGAPRDGGDRHTGRAEVTYRMPYSVWLGVRGPILPGYDLVAAGRWQNLSRHQLLDVRLHGGDLVEAGAPEWYPRYRGLRDVWLASVGLEGQETGRMRLGGRLRVETGATTDRTVAPLQVDGLNLGAGVGIEVRVAQHLVIQAGYDLAWFPEVDSTDSAFDPLARLACVDSSYDFDQCGAARDGRALPTAAGRYGRLRHALTVSLRYDSL